MLELIDTPTTIGHINRLSPRSGFHRDHPVRDKGGVALSVDAGQNHSWARNL